MWIAAHIRRGRGARPRARKSLPIGLAVQDARQRVCDAVPASVIDEDPAHHLGRNAKEVCLTVPINLTLVDEPQVHLVNERRWLQRMVGPFAPKLAGGYATELRIATP
jgi:hypothetical protein